MAAVFRLLQNAPRLRSLRMSSDGPHLATIAMACPGLAIRSETAALLAACTGVTSLVLQVICSLPPDGNDRQFDSSSGGLTVYVF